MYVPTPATSYETLPAKTLSEVFLETVERREGAEAIRYAQRRSHPPAKATTFAEAFDEIVYTWKQYGEQATGFAKALIAKGVAPGSRITIQGCNTPKWLFSNLGVVLAGGVSAGIYPNNGAAASQYCAVDSGASVVVVQDEEQLQKYRGMESAALKCIVTWNKVKDKALKADFPVPVYEWEEFLRAGESVNDETLKQRVAAQTANDVCSLIYTSGTTGMPKAAELTHDNLTWTGLVAGKEFSVTQDDRSLSYLPLSHIAAQQLDCIVPITVGSAVNIAASDALKGSNLKAHLVHCRPSYFLAIPRVWEKFKGAIEQKVAIAPLYKRVLFRVASSVGRRVAADYKRIPSQKVSLLSTVDLVRRVADHAFLQPLFKRLVYNPLKEGLGLDRARLTASGAAPISDDVLRFFSGLNIRIMDLYGMSESSGPATISLHPRTPDHSCGRALSGTEILIADPNEKGEGEVRMKGRHVFKGYWNNPAATAATFDEQGYLRSGDQGRLDDRGNLFITGRYKELIVTAGGENIPPVQIEQEIKRQLPILSRAVVIGDRRRFLSCLLTLECVPNSDGSPSDRLASGVIEQLHRIGSRATTASEAVADPKVLRYLEKGIARANRHATSRAQQVQRITLLPRDFSISDGTLTPTLKLKRSVISEHYHDEIERMYSSLA